MVRVRLPLGAILLALCSIALASSGGDTAPRRDNVAATNAAASSRDNAAASLQSHGDAAALSYSSFLRKQESISLPFVYLRDSANGGFAAANGKQPSAQSALIIRSPLRAMDSRLRGNDDLVRGLVVDVANDSGDAFDNFYQQAQLRMLSALDDSLAAFAADALYDNDAIKSAGIRFQSPLGGRKAQLGADIIGAMDERHDETNQYAIGWQLHIFAAEKGNKGASGGIFYRRITNNILYGVNIFADYEDHDYGEFYRWGLGGELKNKHVKFAANYYLPIGGDKTINSTVLAYSREGYDANLQIAIPGASYLQAEAAYYYYEGKRKGEEDKGFRYGAALSPGKGVVVKIFYDDGGDDFGGELSWHYLFNNPGQKDPQRHDTPNISSADLFAPVLREYSQRIALVTVDNTPRLLFPAPGVLTVGVEGVAAILAVSANIRGALPSGFRADGNVLLFSASIAGEVVQPLTITNAALTLISFLTIRAVDVPITGGGVASGGNVFLLGTPGRFSFTLGGGHLTMDDYAINLQQSGNAFSRDGNVLTFQSNTPTMAIATLIADDNNARTMPITLLFTAAAVQTLSAQLIGDDRRFMVNIPGTVGSLTVAGGVMPYNYQSSNGAVVVDNGGLVVLTPQSNDATLTAVITIDDNNTPVTPPVEIAITLTAFSQPPFAGGFSGYHSRVFLTQFLGTVGTLSVTGGSGSYSYSAPPGSGFVVDNNGVIRVSNNAAGNLTATITANDTGQTQSPPVSAIVTAKFITQCGYIAGCSEFGHSAGGGVVPPLTRVTLMYRAGVGAVDNQTTHPRNAASPLLQVFNNEARPFYQFIIDTGQINDVAASGNHTGQAALDAANRFNPPQATWLAARGARCNLHCRMNQTNLTGGTCLRDTGFGTSSPAVPAGADCTIANP